MASAITCLVTGGTRGIGLAIAQRLTRDGFTVWTCSTTSPEETKVHTSSERHIVVDFRNPADSVGQLIELLPAVDVLINNAGIGTAASLVETDRAFLNEMLSINLIAPTLLMRAYVPGMVERGFGRVINISSISGKFGNSGRLAYASSKHGLIGASRCVSDEVSAAGVTVNVVCPGPTDTRMLQEIAEEDPSFLDKIKGMIKIGRLVRPEEVANLVSFLTGPQGEAITGQSLVIDGGVIQS